MGWFNDEGPIKPKQERLLDVTLCSAIPPDLTQRHVEFFIRMIDISNTPLSMRDLNEIAAEYGLFVGDKPPGELFSYLPDNINHEEIVKQFESFHGIYVTETTRFDANGWPDSPIVGIVAINPIQ